VHLACAIWTPETHLTPDLAAVDGIARVRQARLKLKCDLCGNARGPKIQCTYDKKCYSAAHPLCARQAGWWMKAVDDGKEGVRMEAHCLSCMAKHRKQQEQRKEQAKGPGKVKHEERIPVPAADKEASGDTNGDGDGNGGEVVEEGGAGQLCSRLWPFGGVSHLHGGGYNVPMRTESSGKASVPYIISGARLHRRMPKPRMEPPVASVIDRLAWTGATVSTRLAAGRSRIHGWGVFAQSPHKAGDFVVEYIGVVLRNPVANRREEREYASSVVGTGTYMFSTGASVIDATAAGNVAQLINHSCEPNCFSRIVGQTGRVVICALRDIQAGEELSYDYRFCGDEVLVCKCGSAKCRGTVNL